MIHKISELHTHTQKCLMCCAFASIATEFLSIDSISRCCFFCFLFFWNQTNWVSVYYWVSFVRLSLQLLTACHAMHVCHFSSQYANDTYFTPRIEKYIKSSKFRYCYYCRHIFPPILSLALSGSVCVRGQNVIVSCTGLFWFPAFSFFFSRRVCLSMHRFGWYLSKFVSLLRFHLPPFTRSSNEWCTNLWFILTVMIRMPNGKDKANSQFHCNAFYYNFHAYDCMKNVIASGGKKADFICS